MGEYLTPVLNGRTFNLYVAAVLGFLAIILTGALLPGLLPDGWPVVDLPLLLVCGWALRLDWRYAFGFAFATGLGFDLIGMHTIGLNALLFTVIGAALYFTAQDRSAHSLPRTILFTFVGALLYRMLLLVSQRLLGFADVIQLETILRVVLPTALLDALLVPFFYWLAQRFSRPPREV